MLVLLVIFVLTLPGASIFNIAAGEPFTPAQVLWIRSETATVFTTSTFDSKHFNWVLFGEFVLAVLVTQMDLFHRLLGTTTIGAAQFGWALLPALALLVCREIGNLVHQRHGEHGEQQPHGGAADHDQQHRHNHPTQPRRQLPGRRYPPQHHEVTR